MPTTKTLFPSVHWTKNQLQTKEKDQEFDKDWDVFSRSVVVPITETDVDTILKILKSNDPRIDMIKCGLDLRKFKDLHFSVQLASSCIKALQERSRNMVKIPASASAAQKKEMEALQNTDLVYETFAREIGTSTDLLKKNIQNITKNSTGLKQLLAINLGNTLSSTSVDSALGQALRWNINPLNTAISKKFLPTPEIQGKLTKIDNLKSLTGLTTVPLEIIESLRGTRLDPANPCYCDLFSYTWTEQFNQSWSYVLSIDYPCGVKWCKKWRVYYPCGVTYCTTNITFGFSANFQVAFELRTECNGILILGTGSSCVSATVAGQTLSSCIEAFVVGGAGLDVNITAGTTAGKCFYGGTLTLGLRSTIGGYTIWEGSLGYDYSVEAPCARQFNPSC